MTGSPSQSSKKRKREEGTPASYTLIPSSTTTTPSDGSPRSATGASPTQQRKLTKKQRRRQRELGAEVTPSAGPHDPVPRAVSSGPSSSTKAGQLAVEYRCLNGKSWTTSLHPKSSLADLSYEAAKKAHLQETGVKLVYKRGPGQEQDIWDDYDLAALRARASANPRAIVILMVYPAAGPSSAASSQTSEASVHFPPATPSHGSAAGEAQDLYFTPMTTIHDMPSTQSMRYQEADTAQTGQKRKTHPNELDTPRVTPATPTEPGSSKSVRFNEQATPQWHSTPTQVRPLAHQRLLHQPVRPSPLAQSSRADDSDAASEVDLELSGTRVASADGAGEPEPVLVPKKKRTKKQRESDAANVQAAEVAATPEVAPAAVPAKAKGKQGKTAAASARDAIEAGVGAQSEEPKKKKSKKVVASLAEGSPGTDPASGSSAGKKGTKKTAMAAISSSDSAATPSPGPSDVSAKKKGKSKDTSNIASEPATATHVGALAVPSSSGLPDPGTLNPASASLQPSGIVQDSTAATAPELDTLAYDEAAAVARRAVIASKVAADMARELAASRPATNNETPSATAPIIASGIPTTVLATAAAPETAETPMTATTAVSTSAKKKATAPRRSQVEVEIPLKSPSKTLARLPTAQTSAAEHAASASAAEPSTSTMDGSAEPVKRKGGRTKKIVDSAEATEAAPPPRKRSRKSLADKAAEAAAAAEAAGLAGGEETAPTATGADSTAAGPADTPSKTATKKASRKSGAAQTDDAPAEGVIAKAKPASKKGGPKGIVATADEPVGETGTAPADANDEAPPPIKPAKKGGRKSAGTLMAEAQPISSEADAEAPVPAPPKAKRAKKSVTAQAVAPVAVSGVASEQSSSSTRAVPLPVQMVVSPSDEVTSPSATQADATLDPVPTDEPANPDAAPGLTADSNSAPPSGETPSSADPTNKPISRNEHLNAKLKKNGTKAVCIICGLKCAHQQVNCPIVKSGVASLEERLEVALAQDDGRDKDLAVDSILRWIADVKARPEKVKGKAKAAKKVQAADKVEATASPPELEDGRTIEAPADETSGDIPTEAEDGPAKGTSDAPASPSVDVIAVHPASSTEQVLGPADTIERPPSPAPAPRVVDSVQATPRPSAPASMIPQLGMHDPTETPLPAFMRHSFKKARKQGSISGVSASTAVIETEGSASGSDSESDSDSGSASGSGSSRSSSGSYSSDADSEGSAERLRVKSVEAEADARIRQDEEDEMGSGNEQDEGSDEGSDEEGSLDMAPKPASQTTPRVYTRTKPPNTGHLSDSTRDDTSESGSSDGDSDTDETDRIKSPDNMPTPRHASTPVNDPNDPASMFDNFFNRPLTQAEKLKVKQHAARMSDVHVAPPKDDDDDNDNESVQSSSEGDAAQHGRADDQGSVIGDFGSDAGDDVDEADTAESVEVAEPPVVEQHDSIEAAEETPRAATVPLATEDIAEASQEPGTPPSATRALSSANTPSKRRFADLDASADPSQEIDDLPGAVALDEARSEEDQAEADAMGQREPMEETSSTPAVPTQLAASQPSPRRTRGSQRVNGVQNGSQPSTPAKPTLASQPGASNRSVRVTRGQLAAENGSDDVQRHSGEQKTTARISATPKATPRPKRAASQTLEQAASSQANGHNSDQEDQLDSSSRPVTPERTPAPASQRSTRRTPSVSASPGRSTRRSSRLRSISADPLVPESSQIASQELPSQPSPLFMSQSQPLYTQHYKLAPDSLESEVPSSDHPTPISRKTPRRVKPSSPIAEEDESMSTPRANGNHVAASSPTPAALANGDMNASLDAPAANGTHAPEASEMDDDYTEGESFILTPVQRPMSQPQPAPAPSFAPTLSSLPINRLRQGTAAVGRMLGWGMSASQPTAQSNHSLYPARVSNSQPNGFDADDTDSEAGLESDDDEQATPNVAGAKSGARYASARDSAAKPKTRTGGVPKGW